MPPPIPIVPTTNARLPVMAGVLGRAFRNNPMILWPMAAVPDMKERIAFAFATIYRAFMETGTMWEAGDGAGLAHWIPPGGSDEVPRPRT